MKESITKITLFAFIVSNILSCAPHDNQSKESSKVVQDSSLLDDDNNFPFVINGTYDVSKLHYGSPKGATDNRFTFTISPTFESDQYYKVQYVIYGDNQHYFESGGILLAPRSGYVIINSQKGYESDSELSISINADGSFYSQITAIMKFNAQKCLDEKCHNTVDSAIEKTIYVPISNNGTNIFDEFSVPVLTDNSNQPRYLFSPQFSSESEYATNIINNNGYFQYRTVSVDPKEANFCTLIQKMNSFGTIRSVCDSNNNVIIYRDPTTSTKIPLLSLNYYPSKEIRDDMKRYHANNMHLSDIFDVSNNIDYGDKAIANNLNNPAVVPVAAAIILVLVIVSYTSWLSSKDDGFNKIPFYTMLSNFIMNIWNKVTSSVFHHNSYEIYDQKIDVTDMAQIQNANTLNQLETRFTYLPFVRFYPESSQIMSIFRFNGQDINNESTIYVTTSALIGEYDSKRSSATTDVYKFRVISASRGGRIHIDSISLEGDGFAIEHDNDYTSGQELISGNYYSDGQILYKAVKINSKDFEKRVTYSLKVTTTDLSLNSAKPQNLKFTGGAIVPVSE